MGDAAWKVYGDRWTTPARLRGRRRAAGQALRRGAADGARHRLDARPGLHGAGLQTGPGCGAAGALPIDRQATGAPVGPLGVLGRNPSLTLGVALNIRSEPRALARG